VLSVLVVAWLVGNHDAVGVLLLVCGGVATAYLLWEAFGRMEKIDRDRMLAALFLLALNPVFWGLFEQAGSSINLFTDRHVDRHIFGWEVPASVFQSVNSMFIILFAPMFAALWVWLGKRGSEPSTPAKFGLALVQVGLGFLALVWGAQWAGLENATPVFFIFLIYALHTTGELCLSPVGLSAMSKLALPRMISIMMGVWFLATAAGDFIAGLIAANIGAKSASSADPVLATLDVYSSVGWFGIGVGAIVLIVSPVVKRLMHLDKLSD
jgi:POT family proton-dependent oligopeptide transporter